MRIVNLDLDRYGPFTDKHLVFRPDAKLHIVFGRNEAGKSCSLAAVTDLLFGIERSTRFDFLHPGKDMRVGACIRDSKGAELSFRRRKNKPALTDLSDRPLLDDALAPFLGGLSRPVFSRAFGLDAEALRKSSDELKQSDGELGAALFSAASGLRGFSDVKAALEADALKLFAKTKSKDRLFYQASDRYEKARKDLRDSETRAGALKALRDDHAAQMRQVETIRERRAVIAAEQGRLARLRRAAPVVRAIDSDAARAAALGALPPAHEGLGDALVAALDKAANASRAQEDAEKRAQKLAGELDAIGVDPALLERADDIEFLQKQSGAYLKALHDLPGVEREEDAVIKSLDALAARLGLGDIPALLARQPDDASRAHVAECITRGKRLQITLATRTTERDREHETLAIKKQERDRRGPLRDPRPFRERLAALAPVLKLAEKTVAQEADIAAESVRITDAAARLTPSVCDIDALAQAQLPSRGTTRRSRGTNRTSMLPGMKLRAS
jgi:chromosome segregation protein